MSLPAKPPPTLPPTHRDHRWALLLLLGILLPLVLMAFLTERVFKHGGFAWDGAILDWYRAHRTPYLTGVAESMALVGGVPVLPILTGLLSLVFVLLGRRTAALFLLVSVFGATLLNLATKVIFQRPRPDELGAVLVEPGFSFPSGHTMANVAFGLALAIIFRRTKFRFGALALGLAWGVLIAMSRNYLGVHYPTDVTVGFLASTAWVVGLAYIYHHFYLPQRELFRKRRENGRERS